MADEKEVKKPVSKTGATKSTAPKSTAAKTTTAKPAATKSTTTKSTAAKPATATKSTAAKTTAAKTSATKATTAKSAPAKSSAAKTANSPAKSSAPKKASAPATAPVEETAKAPAIAEVKAEEKNETVEAVAFVVPEELNEEKAEQTAAASAVEDESSSADAETPLDKNVKLMSPMRMVLRRFFRSKLSITGLVILVALFLFSWFGPVVYNRWGETETDYSGVTEATDFEVTDEDGVTFIQFIVESKGINTLAPPSSDHLLGTDEQGMDIFTRLMYGGRLSLTISFLAVFLTTALGIVFGGIAGYYGGVVDNIIMRICDIFICLPMLPLMLILGTVLTANDVPSQYYIYLLMILLSLFSWPGMARLVRGQILFLREQEYMVAAEAMGYSTGRKIFKHLIPNILPQILVSMTLSLGSMILYESTLSYLGLGVKIPYASWGTMIEIISKRPDILQNHFNVWVPSGICILLAVLGFNFIGDGLRDALDPKQRR